MRNYMDVAVRAARTAGEFQRERLWSDNRIEFKGEVDLVTEIDKKSEEMIVGMLREAFPDHDILAEENVYASTSAACKWIIDPLDGTTNYAHGFPWFAVSIALEVNGEVELGVIYHPMADELFSVVRGKRAYLNGWPIHVSLRSPLRSSLLATGFPYDRTWDNENNFDNFMKLQMSARAVRRGGAAALDLAYVAAGRLDGYWEVKLKPWDVAAGKLLVEAAGGKVTNHAGEAYSVYDHRIVASNGIIHDEILDQLHRKEKGSLD